MSIDKNRNEPQRELLSETQWSEYADSHSLSGREIDVVKLLCRGYRNQEILDDLGIQLPTLRTHLRTIYRKLDCRSRVETVLHVVHFRIQDNHDGQC